MNKPQISVIIGDDHEIARKGLERVIEQFDDFKFLGSASNGKALLEMARKLKPDVILTDVVMPVMNGVDVTYALCAGDGAPAILAISMFENEEYIADIMAAGASGYITKSADGDEIADAIRAVYNGNIYYCRTTSRKLTGMMLRNMKPSSGAQRNPAFSKKELELISLICCQYNNKEIAAQMGLSVRTVESYRYNVQEKMRVKGVAGIVVYAVSHGLYHPPSALW